MDVSVKSEPCSALYIIAYKWSMNLIFFEFISRFIDSDISLAGFFSISLTVFIIIEN